MLGLLKRMLEAAEIKDLSPMAQILKGKYKIPKTFADHKDQLKFRKYGS
jgi:hypothetical protein